MDYKVVITPIAQRQFDRCVGYIVNHFQNRIAARALIKDFNKTVISLQSVAGSLPLLQDPDLQVKGYRKILFLKHDYLMVYHLDGQTAVVDAVFHTLQDYENALK